MRPATRTGIAEGSNDLTEATPLLRVRFDGEAVGPGRIPVAHLQNFLTALNQVFQRTARVLRDGGASVRRGQPSQSLRQEVELSLVMLTHGSDAAVLGFDRSQTSPSLPGMDLGLEAIERAVHGLTAVQAEDLDRELPPGYDAGVLAAWRDAGKLFNQGIDEIEFSLSGESAPVLASLTRTGVARLGKRLRGPEVTARTLEGRLLMGDFKESDLRCRVHPTLGDPVECRFDESRRNDVLRNLLGFVRVTGESTVDVETGKIRRFDMESVERLDEPWGARPGAPVAQSFWRPPDLEELAKSQSVCVMEDVEALYRTWPGEDDDGFEQAVDELRRVDAGAAGGP